MDERSHMLDRVIHPKSLAVVGASSNPGKFGWLYPKSLMTLGFPGKWYPISKNATEILGVAAYPSLTDLPEVPDLAVITIPAKEVPAALEEARAMGIPGAIVISSGFAEEDGAGKKLQQEVREIAKRGIRVIGPNCFGTYSPRAGVTMIPGPLFAREEGPVGFFAQSGGISVDLAQLAISHGIRFSAVVSYGNAVDVDEIALLEYYAEDPKTKIIAAYIEGVKDGRRFFELLKKVTTKKPVVIWKAGTTVAGSRAAMSHTGSLGGEGRVWEGMLAQAGVITVRGLQELIDVLMALTFVYPRGGKNITIVGGGGGLAVEAADLVEASGLVLPQFDVETKGKIAALLQGAGSSPTNPVDAGNPLVAPDKITEMLKITAALREIETLFVVQLMFHIQVLMRTLAGTKEQPLSTYAFYPALAKGVRSVIDTFKKPVIGVFINTSTSENETDMELELEWRKARKAFIDIGVPVYPTIERAMNALSKTLAYRDFINQGR